MDKSCTISVRSGVLWHSWLRSGCVDSRWELRHLRSTGSQDFWCSTRSQEGIFPRRCSPSRKWREANTVALQTDNSFVAKRLNKPGSQEVGNFLH